MKWQATSTSEWNGHPEKWSKWSTHPTSEQWPEDASEQWHLADQLAVEGSTTSHGAAPESFQCPGCWQYRSSAEQGVFGPQGAWWCSACWNAWPERGQLETSAIPPMRWPPMDHLRVSSEVETSAPDLLLEHRAAHPEVSHPAVTQVSGHLFDIAINEVRRDIASHERNEAHTEHLQKRRVREHKQELAFRILDRQWLSDNLGHIVCRGFGPDILTVVPAKLPCPSEPDGEEAPLQDPTLLEGPDEEVLARIELENTGPNDGYDLFLTLTLASSSLASRMRRISDSLKVWKDKSSAKRVIWIDTDNNVVDKWDGHLLDAVSDAGAWLQEHSLREVATLVNPAFHELAREATASNFTVGLCMSTRDRLWQLKRALPINLLLNWPHRKWSKIHVVDCGSTDETLEWITTECRAAIEAGVLHVYTVRNEDFPHWHASVGKNCAHAVANEDILVNVDSDNIVGPDFVQHVAKMFREGSTVLQYENGEGTCGRIACWRAEFQGIRGYDEDAYPMGGQDSDFRDRLKSLPGAALKRLKVEAFSHAIPNTLEDKVKACDPRYNIKWTIMDAVNRELFGERRAAGQIVRNLHKEAVGVPVFRVALEDPCR